MTPKSKKSILNNPNSAPAESNQKAQPYFKLTVEDVKCNYQQGLMTASGYLYYIIKTSRKDGWDFRIPNIYAFCDRWGLKRATFYKAKNRLIQLGLIEEEIYGEIRFRVVSDSDSNVVSLFETPVTFVDSESTFVDIESQKVDVKSQKVDTNPPQTTQNQASQNPYRSSTDLSHTNPPPTPGVCVNTNTQFSDLRPQTEETFHWENPPEKIPGQIQTSKLKPEPQEVEIPADFLSRMKNLGVNLGDRELQAALHRYPGRVEDAIAAAEEKRDELRYPTKRPSAEQLLKAFCNITLFHYRDGTVEYTLLNDLQQRILALMAVPETIYDTPSIIPNTA